MLSIRSIFLLAVLALFNIVSAATPPGCLLAAVNTQKDPSDMKLLCGSASKKVQTEILKVCDDADAKQALAAYSKSCSDAGNKVEIISIPSTMSTMSTTGTVSVTATGSVTAPVEATASATSTGGEPIETGNAGASLKSKSIVVAAIAAIVGAAAM